MEDLKRQSNFELLRIVAMLLIIAVHVCHYGIFPFWYLNENFLTCTNSFLTMMFSIGGKVGVDIFVLISGYFLINSQFKISKFWYLLSKTVFYTILLYIAALYCGFATFDWNITDIIYEQSDMYWFVTAYLILYLFFPYINDFVKTLSQKSAEKLLILGSIFWFIFPTLSIYQHNHVSYTVLFFYMYTLGACIRLNKVPCLNNFHLIKRAAFYSLVFLTSLFAFNIFSNPCPEFWTLYEYISDYSIFCIIFALYLFTVFKNLDIKYNPIINSISNSVLAIYILHENKFFRDYIWTKPFNMIRHMNSEYFILYLIGTIITVFICCLLIDKLIGPIFDKIFKLITTKVNKKSN